MTKDVSAKRRLLVSDIGPNDVLLGRGAGPNEHIGNISFRQIVADHKKTYMTTTNRKIKNQIAQKAIRVVKANNGRFLEKVKDKDGELYTVADEKVVLEKTKQALRHLDRPKKAVVACAYPQVMFLSKEHANELKLNITQPHVAQSAPQPLINKSPAVLNPFAEARPCSPVATHPTSLVGVLEQQLSLAAANRSRQDDLVTLLAINSLRQAPQRSPLQQKPLFAAREGLVSCLPLPVSRPDDTKAILAAEKLRSAIALLRTAGMR